MNSHPRKSILVLVIGVIALSFWLPRHREILRSRKQLVQMHGELAGIQNRLANVRTELAKCVAQNESHARERSHATAPRINSAALEDWSKPPTNWPDWNPKSPYIWLHKDILPRLEIAPFGKDGSMTPMLASMLAIPAEDLKRLNARLGAVVTSYHEVEQSQVEQLDDGPADPASGERKISIRVGAMGDEAAQCDKEVDSALREILGAERADFVMESAIGWLSHEFGDAGHTSKTFTVIRRPDGTGSVSVILEGPPPVAEGGSPVLLQRGRSTTWPSHRSERITQIIHKGFLDKPGALEPYVPSQFLEFFSELSPMPLPAE